jgi:hypothetical protein
MTNEQQIAVLENGPSGGVIAGPPAVLADVCRRLGFKNPCRDGRVYLTAPKMRAIGCVDAIDTGWRSMTAAQIDAKVALLLAVRP